jgi:hypothetical protein
MSKNVIRHLTEILVCLVDEAIAIPPGVMDCIIGQFTEFANVSLTLSTRAALILAETRDTFFPIDCGCL